MRNADDITSAAQLWLELVDKSVAHTVQMSRPVKGERARLIWVCQPSWDSNISVHDATDPRNDGGQIALWGAELLDASIVVIANNIESADGRLRLKPRRLKRAARGEGQSTDAPIARTRESM